MPDRPSPTRSEKSAGGSDVSRHDGPTHGHLASNIIQLRTILPTELDNIEKWWKEPEANWPDGGDHIGPSDEFRNIFRSRVLRGTEISWYMIESRQQSPVGYVLYRTCPDDESGAEVAMRLSKPVWGKGYGTEAFRLSVDHLFSPDCSRQTPVIGVAFASCLPRFDSPNLISRVYKTL